MDGSGGCERGGGEERKVGDISPPSSTTTTATLSHTPKEKERVKTATEKLLAAAGEQWSQEENGDEGDRDAQPQTPPRALSNGIVAVNGLHSNKSPPSPEHHHHPLSVASGAGGTGTGHTADQSLLNNNLVEEKCNLGCADDKSFCLYHKFPGKVNNNVYPEKRPSVKDGMDEYFRMHASPPGRPPQQPQPSQPQPSQVRRNELSPSRDPPKYPDQLNLLNGEEEDEDDGCIYTYKGENFEANLSHLIDMCLSCGLPNTERSIEARGTALAHRLRTTRPDPPHQNNLFSPDMDFLEMDFDPGPNGDGDGDSDCEDNCVDECDSRLGREHAAAFSLAGALNPISVLDRKANNYCSEMRNLMCKRCESSICDGKIDNVALNLSVNEVSSPLNIGRGPNAGLDDRPKPADSALNVPRDGMNLPKDLNVKLNQFCDVKEQRGRGSCAPLAAEEDYDPPDNDSVENNLGEADLMDMIDDDFCEDADDEDGDDSNSERYEAVGRFRGGSEGAIRGHVEDPQPSVKTHNRNNNNLGSVSAPEVSPAKEYSPLEKFGRSVSFHNQLSSPKYENVCFSHRPKKEEQQPPELNQVASASQSDTANLEACAGRLHRRENSVFNILSDPSTSQNVGLNCSGSASGVGSDNNHPACVGASTTCTTTAKTTTNTQPPPPFSSTTSQRTTPPPPPPSTSANCVPPPSSSNPCHLPVKSLRPKNTNPAQDPNTASEGERGGEESCPRVTKVMIWTELQASARQVTQIATSACGATAVINVLLALDYSQPVEEVQLKVKTRLRAESAGVVDYLLSRAVAGTTHTDLIQAVTQLSRGAIQAKFFHMFPKRAVQLSRWLARWISLGGVPLATLNLQVGVAPGQTVPDAWHHQMIFGVGPQGIYLTNPLECVSDCLLSDQLCTDSVLLVRRADVVGRWGQGDKLVRLTRHQDPRWINMNVLGQVVGVLKEQAGPPVVQGRRHLTSHVAIPAAYQSGVTIFMAADNPHAHTLLEAGELPLLE